MAMSIRSIVEGIVLALKQFKEENPEHTDKLDIMEDYLTDEGAPWFDDSDGQDRESYSDSQDRESYLTDEEDRDDEPCY